MYFYPLQPETCSITLTHNRKHFAMKYLIITLVLLISCCTNAFSQNFKSDLRKLDAQVETAYKSKKLSENEYRKLKNEQEIIKLAIGKAAADDYMSPDEKNKIHSKIIRSKKRLAKYKTNREIY
jgi:cell division protein FtsL